MDLFLKKNRPLDLFYIIYFQGCQKIEILYIVMYYKILLVITVFRKALVQFERRSKALKTFGRIPYLMEICEKFIRIKKIYKNATF